MTRRVRYEAGVQATSEDITDRIPLYSLDITQRAEEGSVALSSITIDDPDGDYDIVGWRRIFVFEDSAAASNTLTYLGWVADKKIIRGPYKTGAGRQWVVSVADMNTMLSFRVLAQPNANRPAETDVQRINWLMSINEMNRITTTEFINTSGGVAMDAVDYRGQTLLDLINDCAQASGKNFFVYDKDAATMLGTTTRGLWYDFADSTAHTSSVRLSNVASDLDDLTFAIADDTELSRDPSRVYSGAYIRYDGGTVYEEDIQTSNIFTRRDSIVPADNVKSAAKATARAVRYLDEMNTEDDRISTSFYVPAAKVNWLRAGQRCRFKASHLPGYEDFVWLRCLSRTVKEVSEELTTEPHYQITVELSTDAIPGEGASAEIALSGSFRVGSAAKLGIGADREFHYGSDLALGYVTAVTGKQYRLRGTVTDCFFSPLGGYDNMVAPELLLTKGGAAHTATTNGDLAPNNVPWSPQDNGQNNDPGTVYVTEWMTWIGAGTQLDIGITATPLSGFWGFDWTVQLSLESRDAP